MPIRLGATLATLRLGQLRVGARTGSANVLSAPSAPTITSATADDGVTYVTVSAPTSDGGAPVLDYYFLFDGIQDEPESAANGNYTFTGDFTGIEVQALAVNAVGAGAPSEPFTVAAA